MTSRALGAKKRKGRSLNDARYREVLEELLQGRDFLFEEATGLGPTTAEVRCNELLGSGRYLDVDPAVKDRAAYGIKENTGEPRYVRPCDPDGFTYNAECIRPQGGTRKSLAPSHPRKGV